MSDQTPETPKPPLYRRYYPLRRKEPGGPLESMWTEAEKPNGVSLGMAVSVVLMGGAEAIGSPDAKHLYYNRDQAIALRDFGLEDIVEEFHRGRPR